MWSLALFPVPIRKPERGEQRFFQVFWACYYPIGLGKGRDKRKRHARKLKDAAPPRPGPTIPEAPPTFEDPDAMMFAKLKPRPKSGAGAVALPEPDDADD